jgi:hypothetical protein
MDAHTRRSHQALLRAISVCVVLFGHGAVVQSAPVLAAGGTGTAQSPASMEPAIFGVPSQEAPGAVPPGSDDIASNDEIEALSANATRLLQEKYGFCITKRSA